MGGPNSGRRAVAASTVSDVAVAVSLPSSTVTFVIKEETQPEEKPYTKSKFFPEEDQKPKAHKSNDEISVKNNGSKKGPLGADEEQKVPSIDFWRIAPIPNEIQVAPILEILQTTKLPDPSDEMDEQDGLDILKKSLLESKNIEVVRKENFFNEEVTEEEREIIAQRVALQQRQFAAYEYREKIRKSRKIRKMFDFVSDEEIVEFLQDCDQDEDEVIYRLTKPNYIFDIRKKIALKYAKEEEKYAPLMDDDQRIVYEQLLKKRSVTLRKTTNDDAKKQYRMCGRLGLDEALQQFQNNKVDPEKAFEGWSQARIKSYQMIDQNPNSYYYRFNAPGEVQRKGQWDEDEKKIFHERLAQVGANGQWGLFSMTIPGRVGYQCSNYYRLLVETQKIVDPNYVLDERGKAHYLFDKKSANGQTLKTFRTHSKHASSPSIDDIGPSVSRSQRSQTKTEVITKKETKGKSKTVSVEADKKNGAGDSKTPSSSSKLAVESSPSTSKKEPNKIPAEDKSIAANKNRKQVVKAGTRRRRPARYNSDGDSEEDELIYDNDFSGSFTSRARNQGESRSGDSDYGSQRKSKRQRRPTAAVIASGVDSTSSGGDKFTAWQQLSSHQSDEEEEIDPTCPLPGFVDPITLEQIIKPAISKYGHVMGYDSWVRCLNNWEGKRNICPLTKKPLTKRDLVVLTLENVEEYKGKIVNL